MSAGGVLVVFLAVLAGAVLIHSGLGKLISPKDLAGTIDDLGANPTRGSVVIARALGLVEVCLGSLALLTGNGIVAVGIIALGFSFSVVGLYVFFTGKVVQCNCFGSLGSSSQLGLKQLGQFPLWLVGGWALSTDLDVAPSTLTDARVGMLAAAVALVSLGNVVALFRALAPARETRLALAPRGSFG